MPTLIPFVKGQAFGNDFLLVPEADVEGRDLPGLARAMCQRHEGIGADGLMLYTFGPSAIRMRLFNADGSASEVSGNGIRCLAALAVRENPGLSRVVIDTPAGEKVLELQSREDDALTFRASMGIPQDIRPHRIPGGRRAHSSRCPVGWESSMRAARRSAHRIATSHTGASHRTPSEVSRPHECLVRKSGSAQSSPHPDLGARSRADASLGHRRMRRRRRGGLVRRGIARRRSDLAGRKPARRMA